jgi:hypothetical protein
MWRNSVYVFIALLHCFQCLVYRNMYCGVLLCIIVYLFKVFSWTDTSHNYNESLPRIKTVSLAVINWASECNISWCKSTFLRHTDQPLVTQGKCFCHTFFLPFIQYKFSWQNWPVSENRICSAAPCNLTTRLMTHLK